MIVHFVISCLLIILIHKFQMGNLLKFHTGLCQLDGQLERAHFIKDFLTQNLIKHYRISLLLNEPKRFFRSPSLLFMFPVCWIID